MDNSQGISQVFQNVENYSDKEKESITNNCNDSRQQIANWLGRSMRIFLSDGRALVGQFLCTDQARNVILGSAHEYLNPEEEQRQSDPRILGLAMVPGKHIVSMQIDMDESDR